MSDSESDSDYSSAESGSENEVEVDLHVTKKSSSKKGKKAAPKKAAAKKAAAKTTKKASKKAAAKRTMTSSTKAKAKAKRGETAKLRKAAKDAAEGRRAYGSVRMFVRVATAYFSDKDGKYGLRTKAYFAGNEDKEGKEIKKSKKDDRRKEVIGHLKAYHEAHPRILPYSGTRKVTKSTKKGGNGKVIALPNRKYYVGAVRMAYPEYANARVKVGVVTPKAIRNKNGTITGYLPLKNPKAKSTKPRKMSAYNKFVKEWLANNDGGSATDRIRSAAKAWDESGNSKTAKKASSKKTAKKTAKKASSKKSKK